MSRTSCIHCGGKLKPSNESDLMGSADNPIHIQIYYCLDCGMRVKIPVPKTHTRLGDESLLMKSPDEIHNDEDA